MTCCVSQWLPNPPQTESRLASAGSFRPGCRPIPGLFLRTPRHRQLSDPIHGDSSWTIPPYSLHRLDRSRSTKIQRACRVCGRHWFAALALRSVSSVRFQDLTAAQSIDPSCCHPRNSATPPVRPRNTHWNHSSLLRPSALRSSHVPAGRAAEGTARSSRTGRRGSVAAPRWTPRRPRPSRGRRGRAGPRRRGIGTTWFGEAKAFVLW